MKIAVDPGHGMSNRVRNVFDPGAIHTEDGVEFREADIALRYGLSLRDVLRAEGHEVFMTRDDSTDHAPVGERAANARNAGAKAFVSLHLNDFDDDRANGVEVLYRREQDLVLAKKIQLALVRATGFRDRGVKKRDDLAVLKFNSGPSVLIELGFIANDQNREVLLNPQKRQQICEVIASSFAGA